MGSPSPQNAATSTLQAVRSPKQCANPLWLINEFADGPERFGVAGVTQKQTKEQTKTYGSS